MDTQYDDIIISGSKTGKTLAPERQMGDRLGIDSEGDTLFLSGTSQIFGVAV